MSLNVDGSVHLIKPAKLYMCTQTHYKHDEVGRTAPGVRGHGSVPLSHSGNVVTRIGLHTQLECLINRLGGLRPPRWFNETASLNRSINIIYSLS